VGSVWLFHRCTYRVPRGGGTWSPLAALENLLSALGAATLKREHSE